MALSLDEVLLNPDAAAVYLQKSSAVFGVEAATGCHGAMGAAILELKLLPLPALAADNYPIERIRIVILSDLRVYSYPRGMPGREFLHRNFLPGSELCLQYDGDDPAMRWLPEDGLEPLVTLVHRHLMFEEYWRRTGRWPIEDAPHGPAPSGTTYPVRTERLRKELNRWVR